MTALRTALLVTASTATFAAFVAAVDHWGNTVSPPLRLAAATTWILYTVASYGERILAAVAATRADIDVYGDYRHGEGVGDGMSRPQPAPIRGLR